MKKVNLCFGGSGPEAKVSVASAQNISRVYNFDRLIFLDQANNCYQVHPDELLSFSNPFLESFRPQSKSTGLGPFLDWVKANARDTYFFGFHGDQGENGVLQKFFEEMQIPFTGSSAASSALCFDKQKAKEKVSQSGQVVMLSTLIYYEGWTSFKEQILNFYRTHGPTVVKPVASGSSVGLGFLHQPNQLESLRGTFSEFQGHTFLLEKFCKGREFTVAVIQSEKGACRPLVASEVILEKRQDQSFDYKAKYLGKGAVEITPAKISRSQMGALCEAALIAHEVLGCYGYSRTDFIYSEEGEVVFLETNTLPGLTKMSFLPQQLNYCEISMENFVQDQLSLARKRYEN